MVLKRRTRIFFFSLSLFKVLHQVLSAKVLDLGHQRFAAALALPQVLNCVDKHLRSHLGHGQDRAYISDGFELDLKRDMQACFGIFVGGKALKPYASVKMDQSLGSFGRLLT